MSSRSILAVSLIACGAAACAPHHIPPPSVRASLTGTWVLNRQASRTEVDTATSAANRRREGEEGFGARGGFGGDEGRGSGYGAARFDPGAIGQAAAALQRGDQRLTIAQTDTTVHFAFADRSYFDLRPDGHRGKDIWRGVGLIQSMARWTDAGLLLERKLDNGVTVDQTFSRQPGSARLTVVTVIKGPMSRKITARDLYDPAPGETAGS